MSLHEVREKSQDWCWFPLDRPVEKVAHDSEGTLSGLKVICRLSVDGHTLRALSRFSYDTEKKILPSQMTSKTNNLCLVY